MHVRIFAIAIGMCLSLFTPIHAQEWTRFRGRNGTGISPAKGLPATITPQNTAWKIALPGVGHSSPVMWGKRLFVTSAEQTAAKRHLLCYSTADGKEMWRQTFTFAPYTIHQYNTSASATPCVDEERVYCTWSSNEGFIVAAFTHEGKEIWKRDLGPHHTQHGGASSPIVHGDLLLLAKEDEGGPGCLLGLNRKTGETKWKVDRPSGPTAYASPFIYKGADGKDQLIWVSTNQGVVSLDPANGQLNWDTGGLFKLRTVGSPILADGLIIATSGEGGGSRSMAAVKPPSVGGKAEIAYRLTRGTSYVPAPLTSDGRIYFWGDGGIVLCVKASNGETLWQERVTDTSKFFASPIMADGKIYNISDRGELVVIAASDTFKLLGNTDLGEPSNAAPAIANGCLFVRTVGHLYCVRAQ
jgi:outer membrane protein assembly factor BamB